MAVMNTVLELVELPDGEIVLRPAGSVGEPWLRIRFSAESLDHLGRHHLDVARIMVQAGMEAAGRITDEDADLPPEPADEPPLLH